jgi:ATP adenylyltransferase
MCILPTIQYEPQTDVLNEADLTAAWAVIHRFETPQMVIYNCGPESGSSQGHKHLQVLPIERQEGFSFFTDGAEIPTGSYTYTLLSYQRLLTRHS